MSASAAALALACMHGCGGGDSSTAATVNGRRIARSTIAQAMYAQVASTYALEGHATTRRPPVPPDFTACIAYLRRFEPKLPGARSDSTPAQLKERCKLEYEREKLKALYFWISYEWVVGEAKELGLKADGGELARQAALFERGFPSKAAFKRYLTLTREDNGGFDATMQSAVLSTQIQHAIETREGLGRLTPAQRRSHFAAFSKAFEAKWRARTDCEPDYVVPLCRQYKPPKHPSPIVPPSMPLSGLE